MPITRTRVLATLLLAVILGGCGKSTPSTPSPTPSPNCRAFPLTYTTVLTAGTFAQTTSGTCSFTRSTLELSCTNNTSDTSGGSTRVVTTTTWPSFDQVLREVSVVPPLVAAMAVNGSTIGTGGASTFSVAYAYDGLARLQRETGTSFVTTYTAWDASGRPIVGSTQPATGAASTLALTYDAIARAKTTTTTTGGQVTTCIQTYDANGNQIASACAGQVSTTNITAVEPVCK